jgi:hypothetical protein
VAIEHEELTKFNLRCVRLIIQIRQCCATGQICSMCPHEAVCDYYRNSNALLFLVFLERGDAKTNLELPLVAAHRTQRAGWPTSEWDWQIWYKTTNCSLILEVGLWNMKHEAAASDRQTCTGLTFFLARVISSTQETEATCSSETSVYLINPNCATSQKTVLFCDVVPCGFS